jgi:hypothetical protein
MPERIFGEIEGVKVGDELATREALSATGVHRPLQAGISGSQSEGADSIALSGAMKMMKTSVTSLSTPDTVDAIQTLASKPATKHSPEEMLPLHGAKYGVSRCESYADSKWILPSLQNKATDMTVCTGWTNFGKNPVGRGSRFGGTVYARMNLPLLHRRDRR